MDDLDFLRLVVPDANATLMAYFPDGSFKTIAAVSPELIAEKCPLLALSFETGSSGVPKSIIEARSSELVAGFLRFLYLDDYIFDDVCDGTGPGLLFHAQMCQMAETFDVPELQVAAHANFLVQTEVSCSQPTAPPDLCDTIRFVYDELAEQRPLLDTILNYCVFCFTYHKLGKMDEFRQLAFELRTFHRDLCRTNYNRGFDDDGAIDIVRLPVSSASANPTEDDRERAALGDFIYELWCDRNASDSETERSSSKRRKTSADNRYSLVCRPRQDPVQSDGDDTDNEKESGFTLVHRPKTPSLAAALDWKTIDGKGKERADLESDEDTVIPSSPSVRSVSGPSSSEDEVSDYEEVEAPALSIEPTAGNPECATVPADAPDPNLARDFNSSEITLKNRGPEEVQVDRESGSSRGAAREVSKCDPKAAKVCRRQFGKRTRGEAVRHDADVKQEEDSDEELYRSAPPPPKSTATTSKSEGKVKREACEDESDSEWALV